MDEERNSQSWEEFSPTGRQKKGSWTSWVWLLIGMALLGALVGGYSWFNRNVESVVSDDSPLLVIDPEAMTQTQFHDGLELHALYGAGAGLFLGAVVLGRHLRRMDQE